MLAIGLKDFDFLKALRVQVFIYLCFHYFVMRFKIGFLFLGDGFLFLGFLFIFGWFFILGGVFPTAGWWFENRGLLSTKQKTRALTTVTCSEPGPKG